MTVQVVVLFKEPMQFFFFRCKCLTGIVKKRVSSIEFIRLFLTLLQKRAVEPCYRLYGSSDTYEK